MWEIDSSETSEIVTKKLEREWNKGMDKYRRTIHTNETGNSNHNNVNNSTINNKTKNLTAIYKTKIENNDETLILVGYFFSFTMFALKYNK
jgi:hypothetical protein